MTQKQGIARAGRCLLAIVKVLLRGAGALFAALGSILLIAFSSDQSGADHTSDDVLEDGLSMIEREDEATVSGWKSW